MALSNYTELKEAVGAWAFNRTDLPAADLVALGEARLNRDLRLRAMEAEASLTAAPGERTLPLPDGFQAALAVWREDGAGRVPLRRVAGPVAVSAAAGWPDFWTIEGETIAFERPSESADAYGLRYLKRLTLSDDAPTNWLLAHHPDAYLAAALVEAALWAGDDEQAVRWQARYQGAVDAINHREAQVRGAPLKPGLPAA